MKYRTNLNPEMAGLRSPVVWTWVVLAVGLLGAVGALERPMTWLWR